MSVRRPGGSTIKAKPVGTQDEIDVLTFRMDRKQTRKCGASHASRDSDALALSEASSKQKRPVEGGNRLSPIDVEMSPGPQGTTE